MPRDDFELDDLKQAWRELDTRLQRQTAINLHLVTERSRDAVQSALRWMLLRQALLAGLWGVVVAIVAPFWIEHRDQTHLLLFGLVLHAYGVLAIANAVLQILVIVRLQYVQPVLTLQRRLLQLRQLRIRSNVLLSLPWWWLWTVAFVVGVKWWSGVDIYLASPPFVYASFSVGVIGLLVTLWWVRRISNDPTRAATRERFVDDLGGRSLKRALKRIDELAAFERD